MTKPKHPRRQAQQSDLYPPGFFSELVRLHRWPPRFEPRLPTIAVDMVQLGRPRTPSAMQVRERQAVSGTGWGAGTLVDVMAGTPATPKPAWMMRPRLGAR